MVALLRNLKINVAMSSVLVCFALSFASVAGLGYWSSLSANDSIELISQINVQQVNEVSRADTLLKSARLSLESANSNLVDEQSSLAERNLSEAITLLEEADAHFVLFVEEPKSEQGQALAEQVEASFREVEA